jgi:alpha-beta hydrolase superfamily lysophospholipase
MVNGLTAEDGTRLNLHEWRAADPRLTVALVHGYAEHAGRYAHVAQALNAHGISVVAVDLRGHGRSQGARGHVEAFTDYHQDLDVLLAKAEEGRPLFILAHSMGALVSTHYLLSGKGQKVQGVVLTSPYLGLALEVSGVKKGAAVVMSRLLPKVSLPSGLVGKDLTRDPEMVRLHDADSLNFGTANARWFTESTQAMELVHARASQLAKPLLLLYGGADRVASADATDRFAAKLTVADREVERLPGFFHEILNEPPAERGPLLERIAAWLLAHAQG